MSTARSALRLHINAVGAVMGGAARHLSPFLAALHEVRPGWSISVWATSSHKPTEVPEAVSVRTLPRYGIVTRLWWESVELPRALRRGDADALLNLTNSGPLHSPVPSLLYQRNPLWFDHGWLVGSGGRTRLEAVARRQLAYLQMRRSAVTVVPSAAMARLLLGWPGSPPAPAIRVIPHAVDTKRFQYAQRPWPPPPDRPIRLLSVSHAAPHKDQILLVRLVALLREQGLDVQLRLPIAREDSPRYFDEIDRERRRLAVADGVELLGRVAHVERLYREADVMIFPSRSESFGFPVLEAMASGLPVVASRIRASEEVLGGDGWFFPPGDLDAAAAAIRGLLETPAHDVATMTARASRAAGLHTWAANATQVVAAIEDSVESRASGWRPRERRRGPEWLHGRGGLTPGRGRPSA